MTTRNNELRAAVLAVVLWSLVVTVVAVVFVRANYQNVDELSINQSRTLFQTIVDFRSWNARHGGVYVPVSEGTPPNPYLNLDRRDVRTSDGQRLTLVNPAYMTRQFAEVSRQQLGLNVHITSRDPIRPANRPNAWEEEALAGFDEGQEEWWAYSVDDQNRPVFRYMAPLITEPTCLPCHAHQGYTIGDVRGGISLSYPADLFVAAKADNLRSVAVTAVAVWILGLALIGLVARTFWQRRQALKRAQELTLLDSLTGVHNRRGFVTLAEEALRTASRHNSKATIVFIDLDDFKSVNDVFGHDEGDVALRRVADVLRATFRGADIIARLGGDEFIVLLSDTSKKAAEAVRTRLWKAVRHENNRSNAGYDLSVSVGMVEFDPENPRNLDELIRVADQEMYTEKRHKSSEHNSINGRRTPVAILRKN